MTTNTIDKPEAAPLQITIKEAARLLSYNPRTIRRLIERGELQAIGAGKLRRILSESVVGYQQRNLVIHDLRE
jgi:excisionase family DNA binding protein